MDNSAVAGAAAVWSTAEAMRLNTPVPVYWEQMEPERGVRLSVVDAILQQAREHRCGWCCCGLERV